MILYLLFFILGCETSEKKIDKADVMVSSQMHRIVNSSDEFYIYPGGPHYKNGDFKLESFEIREKDNEYILVIEIENQFRNELNNQNGWDTQVFDIYLFTNMGEYRQSLAGRKVKFSTLWEQAIVASPGRVDVTKKEVFEKSSQVYDDVSEIENLSNVVYVSYNIFIFENKLNIKLPKSKFVNVMNRLTGVQVLMTAYDPYPNDGIHVREVEEFPTRWHFGGGSFSSNGPNVISILGPNDKLSTFENIISKRVYATIDMVKIGCGNK